MNDLADALVKAKPQFAQERLQAIMRRAGSTGFMILDPES